MIRLRAVFEKKGRAKYISHLDLNRCMVRIFRRSKLPIWYTEGFNPHPYFSFALALSLGFESSCEIFDFNITEEMPLEEVRDSLNRVMPEGMRVISVTEQKKKITEIAKAEYDITVSGESTETIREAFDLLLSRDSILIEKKTKKGMKEIDIKPCIDLISVSQNDDKVKITMRLPAGTQTNLNPSPVLEELKKVCGIGIETENIIRTGILCENNEIFL